jgi:CubicO group peptidase (beta-lactamase class C family)
LAAARGEDPNRAFSPTAYNSGGGGGMSGTIGDYARFLQMLLNEGELDGEWVLRTEIVRQMTQNATGSMPPHRGPGWGFTLGFGILTEPAAAKSRLPAGSYGWGGICGTQFLDRSGKPRRRPCHDPNADHWLERDLKSHW